MKVSPKAAGWAAATVIAVAGMAYPVTKQWEGSSNDPYQDIVGVKTVCYGETRVEMRRYTDEECALMLMKALQWFATAISRCVPDDVPLRVKAAIVSWAYNVGADAACTSTLVRKLNAGDIAGACAELDRWVMAGGRRVQGLANRRKAERELCEGRGAVASLGATG